MFWSPRRPPFDHLRALAAKEGIPSNKLREFTPKGGESLEEVKRRVVDFFSNHFDWICF